MAVAETEAGGLTVRLARTPADRVAAQRLRYRVFAAGTGTGPESADHARAREADRFDPYCDHLLVLDGTELVGTCRMLPAGRAGETGFAAEAEFALSALLGRHAGLRFCEVGRACTAPERRSGRIVEALWAGLWAYARRERIDVYFGAASFAGTDPEPHAMALSYLHHRIGAPSGWRAGPHAERRARVKMVPAGEIEAGAALRAMPPLLRGYLRLGAHVGDGAAVDPGFGTTDVLVLCRLAGAPKAWRRRFSALGAGLVTL